MDVLLCLKRRAVVSLLYLLISYGSVFFCVSQGRELEIMFTEAQGGWKSWLSRGAFSLTKVASRRTLLGEVTWNGKYHKKHEPDLGSRSRAVNSATNIPGQ